MQENLEAFHVVFLAVLLRSWSGDAEDAFGLRSQQQDCFHCTEGDGEQRLRPPSPCRERYSRGSSVAWTPGWSITDVSVGTADCCPRESLVIECVWWRLGVVTLKLRVVKQSTNAVSWTSFSVPDLALRHWYDLCFIMGSLEHRNASD
jgi:hypothetical protein